MKCAICGQECHAAFLQLGGYCGSEHRDELLRRHRQRLDELRGEEVTVMPAVFTLDDFERFALKLAVHLLHGISPAVRNRFRQKAPQLLDPLEMSLELKERILRELPATHVSLVEARGLARMFHGGTYSFLQPVPAQLVREALARAHLLPILTGLSP